MSRALGFLCAIAVITTVTGSAAAAGLGLASATIDVFHAPVAIAPTTATVDVEPESLGQRSTGLPITVFFELPATVGRARVEFRSVRLCRGSFPCSDGVAPIGRPRPGDQDREGARRLRIAFDRAATIGLVSDVVVPTTVTFTVSGLLSDGAYFAGSDLVRIVDP